MSRNESRLPTWIEVPEAPGENNSSRLLCIELAATSGGRSSRSLPQRCTQVSSASSSITLASSYLMLHGAEAGAEAGAGAADADAAHADAHATLFYTINVASLGSAMRCLGSLRASARYLICASNDANCSVCSRLILLHLPRTRCFPNLCLFGSSRILKMCQRGSFEAPIQIYHC